MIYIKMIKLIKVWGLILDTWNKLLYNQLWSVATLIFIKIRFFMNFYESIKKHY